MASNEAAQVFGNGEGGHEVMAGKLAAHVAFEPLPGFKVLACRAMAIAARAVNDMDVSTLLTFIIGDARILGTARDDGIHCFSVLLRHGVSKVIDILRTEGAEDLTYRCHS